jgi:hypothetical protein
MKEVICAQNTKYDMEELFCFTKLMMMIDIQMFGIAAKKNTSIAWIALFFQVTVEGKDAMKIYVLKLGERKWETLFQQYFPIG